MERERYSARSRLVWEVVSTRDGQEIIIEAFPTQAQAVAQAEKLDRDAEHTSRSVREVPSQLADKDD
jgi:hypothetical protein